MLIHDAIVAAEHPQQIVVNECRMTATAHWYCADRIRRVPFPRPQIQINDLRIVYFFLWMIWTVSIAPTTKYIHAILQYGGRMEIAIAGRCAGRLNVRPVHRYQIQAVNITLRKSRSYWISMWWSWKWREREREASGSNAYRKLIDFLFEAAEYVHAVVDNARRMAISNARNAASHLWLRPSHRLWVKAKQNIASVLIVSAAPQINFILIGDGCMAVALKWHLWILERRAASVFPSRNLKPP